MNKLILILLLIIVVIGILKPKTTDPFVDIVLKKKWYTREIYINNLSINNAGKELTVYEGERINISIDGIVKLMKAPIHPNYDLVSTDNRYVFTKKAFNQNLETPGISGNKKMNDGSSWCGLFDPECKGYALFLPGSKSGSRVPSDKYETKLFNTNRIVNTGSCRNSQGPITCADPFRFKYNDGRPDKLGDFGFMSKERCSQFRSQGGGWEYKPEGCTEIVGEPDVGGGTKLSLIYTKKYNDKPCDYDKDCGVQGLNPVGSKQPGKWMCPGMNKLCSVYCNTHKDCKNAGLKPIITKSCYKLVDDYCRKLPIWKQYNIKWGNESFGRKLPGLASQNQSQPQWRCYSKDALTADKMNYNGKSSEYTTVPELEGVWNNCLISNQIGKWQCPSKGSYCSVKCNSNSDCSNAGLTNHICPSNNSFCKPIDNSADLEKVPIMASPYIQSYPNKKVQIYMGIKGISMINIFNSTTYNNAKIPSGDNIQNLLSFTAPYEPGQYKILLGIEFSETPNINYSKLNENMVLGYLTIKKRYEWRKNEWKSCNVPCSGGIQKRDVYCYDILKNKHLEKTDIYKCDPQQFQVCVNPSQSITSKPPLINNITECSQDCLNDNSCKGSVWDQRTQTCQKILSKCVINKSGNSYQYGCKKELMEPCSLKNRPTSTKDCNTQRCPPRPPIYNMKVQISLTENDSLDFSKYNNYSSNLLKDQVLGIRMNHSNLNNKLYKDVFVYTGKISDKLESQWHIIDAGSKNVDFGVPKCYIFNYKYNAYLTYTNNMGLFVNKQPTPSSVWKIKSIKGGPIYYIKHIKSGLYLNSTIPGKGPRDYLRLNSPPKTYDYGLVRCASEMYPWLILPPKPQFFNNMSLENAQDKCNDENSKLCTKVHMDTYNQIGFNPNKCTWTDTIWKSNPSNYIGFPEKNVIKRCSWIKKKCARTDPNSGECSLWQEPQAQAMCCPLPVSLGSTLNSYVGTYICRDLMKLNNQQSKCIDNYINISKRGNNLVLNGDGETRNVAAIINNNGYLDINGITGYLTSEQPNWVSGKIKNNRIYMKLSNGQWWLKEK